MNTEKILHCSSNIDPGSYVINGQNEINSSPPQSSIPIISPSSHSLPFSPPLSSSISTFCSNDHLENKSAYPESIDLGDSLQSEENGYKVLFDLLSEKGSLREDCALNINKEGKLLLSLLHSRGIVNDQIKSYEYFIQDRIPEILRQRVINLEDGTHVAFTNVHQALPSISGKDGHSKPLFPQEARERLMTYAVTVMIDLERRYHDGRVVMTNNKPDIIRNVEIGKIPVMLGSKYDNLQVHNICDYELLRYGECPFDPRGYFVVAGQDKLIMIQERLRAGRILIFANPKGDNICRMTCLTTRGSTIVELTYNVKQQCIRLHLQVFKGKRRDITIIQAFQILGFTDTNQIVDFILFFVRPEWRMKVRMKLQGSILVTSKICGNVDPLGANLKDIYDECIYTGSSKGRKKNQTKFNYDNYQQANGLNRELLTQEIYQLVINSLFPNIDLAQAKTQDEYKSMIEAKKVLLGVMTARYAEFLAGLTPKDDRDSWTNKRLEMGGRIMEKLFRRLWDMLLDDIENDISGPAKRKTLETIKQKITPSLITDTMESSFVPNQWGTPNSNKEQNVTDFVNREESILSIYYQMLTVNTPTNRRAKQAGARGVQIDQIGSICPVQTPSGEACGLVKGKAIGCWISVQSDEISCWKYLKDNISKDYSSETANLCILNGRPLGWCNGKNVREIMVEHRRSAEIPFDTALVLDKYGMFNVYTDSCRPTKPYLIVDENGVPLVTKYNAWDCTFNDLLLKGMVEYLDIWEAINHANVACSITQLEKENEEKVRLKHSIQALTKKLINVEESNFKDREALDELLANYKLRLERLLRKKYTHVDIDPNINQGMAANVIPYIDHNQSPRNNFQCSMGRQAMGINHSNPGLQFPTTGRYLANPAPALTATQVYKYIGLDNLPAGRTVILAIITDRCNEEDGVAFKKEALEAGVYDYTVVHSYETIVRNSTKISNGEMSEHLLKPKKAFPRHRMEQYDHLDDNGLVSIGAVVKSGDCLIGKLKRVKIYRKGTRNTQADYHYEDNSVYLDTWEEGIVDDVRIRRTINDEMIVNVKIRVSGRPIIGDKVATRAAQKSVISRIIPASELPYTKDGITPDILINPHALPKRMTISTYFEIVASKLAALSGIRIDASGFKHDPIDKYRELLETLYNYNGFGEETLYYFSGGKQLKAKIMIGPSYYQYLKHQVLHKAQYRGEGSKVLMTRQPPRGRKQNGGVRFGEQELSGTLGHGAPNFLNDRMLKACDDHRVIVCVKCHTPAIANVSRGIIICKTCHGDNFAVSRQAYTMSLLMNLSAITNVRIKPIYGSDHNTSHQLDSNIEDEHDSLEDYEDSDEDGDLDGEIDDFI